MWKQSKPIIPVLLVPTAALIFNARCGPQAVSEIQGQMTVKASWTNYFFPWILSIITWASQLPIKGQNVYMTVFLMLIFPLWFLWWCLLTTLGIVFLMWQNTKVSFQTWYVFVISSWHCKFPKEAWWYLNEQSELENNWGTPWWFPCTVSFV